MTDLSIYENYQLMAERSKAKRAANRESSVRILIKRGIEFESKNAGAHLIVKHAGITVDYWPGTGKFIARNQQGKGRGIFTLIKFLNKGKAA